MTRPARAQSKVAGPAILTIPGRWAEEALCAQAHPDAWFPDKGQRGLAAIATRICGHCPVRTQCLDYALSGADTWGGIATGIWGRHHTPGTRPAAAAAESGGGVTSTARPRRRRPRATARQALSLCEADLQRLTWDKGDMPQGKCGRPRVRVVTTRAALRAAGVPPDLAAALRRRLRLIPEEETGR